MHRTQILLPHWLNEYVDIAAKKCSISKGEMIRCMTSLGILLALKARGSEPENYDNLMKTFEDIQKDCDSVDIDQVAVFHDDLYYETRKAIENRLLDIQKKD